MNATYGLRYRNPRGPDYWYGVDDEGFARIEVPRNIFDVLLGPGAAGGCMNKHTFDKYITQTPAAAHWYHAEERRPMREYLNTLMPNGYICVYVVDAGEESTFDRFLRYHEQGHILFDTAAELSQMVTWWVGPSLLIPYLSGRLSVPVGEAFAAWGAQPAHLRDPDDPRKVAAVVHAYAEIFADLWALSRLRDEGRDLDTVYREDGGLLRHLAIARGGLEFLSPEEVQRGLQALRETTELSKPRPL